MDTLARKQRPAPNTSAWMNTYADMVTLLLCFFVMLYSMTKWQRFASAFQNVGIDADELLPDQDATDPMAPGGPQQAPEDAVILDPDEMPTDFNQLYEYLKQYTQEHGMSDSVQLFKGEDTVYIRFNNNIFFFPDRAVLKEESLPILGVLGDCLHNVEDEIYLININGHTASVEYENYPVSAWTLSGERATNIAIFLEDQKSISPKKLRPIGYGDNYPVATNDTEEGRMQNRRVDMVIISNEAEFAKSGSVYEQFAGLFDPNIFPREGGISDLLDPTSEPHSSAGQPQNSQEDPQNSADGLLQENP